MQSSYFQATPQCFQLFRTTLDGIAYEIERRNVADKDSMFEVYAPPTSPTSFSSVSSLSLSLPSFPGAAVGSLSTMSSSDLFHVLVM